jgi:hypothetical protein
MTWSPMTAANRFLIIRLASALTVAILAAGCSISGSAYDSRRPRAVAMAGIDACQVLIPDQLIQLGVQTAPDSVEPASKQNNNSSNCLWTSVPGFDFSKPSTTVFVEAVSYLGVDDVFARATNVKNWTAVQGFRALQLDKSERPEDPSFQFYIDVDNEQSLNVASVVHDWHGSEQDGKATARDIARRAADFAVTTLLAR